MVGHSRVADSYRSVSYGDVDRRRSAWSRSSVTAEDSTGVDVVGDVDQCAFSSSVSKEARSIPAAAKAASVGAKTVKGHLCSADTKFACVSAATSASCSPVSVRLLVCHQIPLPPQSD